MSIDSLHPDQALAERLERAKPDLAAASLRYMDADPFWRERYGARADRFAREDAGYHVTYLIAAVWEGSLTPLREYARWLRTVLVSRGMCTRHLSAHFEELQRTLRADPAIAPAADHLESAIDALRYEHPAAAALQARASALGARVSDLSAARPFHSAIDGEHLLHYLADAMNAGDERSLITHLRWTFERFSAEGRASDVAGVLDRLSAALANADAHGAAANEVLSRAITGAQSPVG